MDHINREAIIEAAQRVAETTDGILSREDFERSTGINQDQLFQAFPDGGWSKVAQMAGIECPKVSLSMPQPRPLDLAGMAATGVLASAFLGATTNMVNGAVSPLYFVTILGWRNVNNVWTAAIAQGIFEGLLFGLFFSLIFTVTTGIITGAACSYGFAIRHMAGIMAGAYACWALGGLLAMGLAALSPEFYRRTFIGVPAEFGSRMAYAWVGGSIWGLEFGGFVCIIVGLVVLRANWRRT